MEYCEYTYKIRSHSQFSITGLQCEKSCGLEPGNEASRAVGWSL